MHGVKGGMTNCQSEMKKAVAAGYWQTFRFNPALKAEGKNPLTIDCKAPTESYIAFIESEDALQPPEAGLPERAEKLFAEAAEEAKARYERLLKLKTLYEVQ